MKQFLVSWKELSNDKQFTHIQKDTTNQGEAMKKIILLMVGLICFSSYPSQAFSAEISEGFYAYKVKKGDQLIKIAPSWAWDTIMRVNRIDSQHLQIEQVILIPSSPNTKISCPLPTEMKSAKNQPRSIYAFINIQYFGAYEYGKLVFWGPISSAGKSHQTPLGTFHISQKTKKYFSHDPACYGAPMPYAMKLSKTSIFLHQQSLPGKSASHGCIRLLMPDAMRLFSWAKIGDIVVIMQ